MSPILITLLVVDGILLVALLTFIILSLFHKHEVVVIESKVEEKPVQCEPVKAQTEEKVVVCEEVVKEGTVVKFDISTFVLSHDQSFGIPKFSFKFGISAVVLK